MIRKLIRRVLALPTKSGRNQSKPKIIPFSQHGIRRDRLSYAAQKVVSQLQEAGYSAYIVGGAVRDLLLGVEPKDFDVATNARPEQVHRLFRRSRIIGRRFRIVHVMFGDETIEVTTFRGGAVSDHSDSGRIMKDNSFGSREEDVYRRDFTVNALLYDPSDESIIDYLHGVKDLHARRLVMIGQPAARYKEDPVRMLRAVRLSVKLGMEIAEDTRKPIRSHAHLLEKEPSARMFDELLKLLLSGHAYACMQRLYDEGLTKGVFPIIDVVMSEQEDSEFVRRALENTDERVRQDKPVSVGFLLAALLWPQVRREWKKIVQDGKKEVHALNKAIDIVEEDKGGRDFSIPRRYSVTMHEIWLAQPRFDIRVGNRPYRLIEQPRFRALYDFLLLRAQAGEVLATLPEWWDRFYNADGDETRQALFDEAKRDPIGNGAGSRKKRGRKKKKKPAAPETETVASSADAPVVEAPAVTPQPGQPDKKSEQT